LFEDGFAGLFFAGLFDAFHIKLETPVN